MLDTIVLSIPTGEFLIRDHDVFTPSSKGLLFEPYYPMKRGGIKCTYNPTKAQKEQWGYMPRLTLAKRPAHGGFSISLRIEFSAPKILFGNNFDELNDDDFDVVFRKLSDHLQTMGIIVKDKALKAANISAIHYSKNLPLTDYTSASMVIKEIAKTSASKRLDFSKTDYRNDGSSIKFHANSHELILYDKLADLNASKISEKRAIENDGFVQLSLLDMVFQKPFDVIRIEARLGNRTKIKQLFARLGIAAPLTFEGIFAERIAKKVLFDYWQMMADDMPVVMASGFAPEDLYSTFYAQNPDTKPALILQKVGALAIIARVGMTGLRSLTERHSAPRTWQRLKKSLRDEPITNTLRYHPMKVAEQQLRAFTPLRLQDYWV
jgi:hypothetical protein